MRSIHSVTPVFGSPRMRSTASFEVRFSVGSLLIRTMWSPALMPLRHAGVSFIGFTTVSLRSIMRITMPRPPNLPLVDTSMSRACSGSISTECGSSVDSMPLTAAYSTFARSRAGVHVGLDEAEDLLQLGRQPPRRVDVVGVEHLALVVDRDRDLVVRGVGLDQHLGDVELHRVERGVEHLLRIDARRVDVAILDPHERHVEDLERRQVVALDCAPARVRRGPPACRDRATRHPLATGGRR